MMEKIARALQKLQTTNFNGIEELKPEVVALRTLMEKLPVEENDDILTYLEINDKAKDVLTSVQMKLHGRCFLAVPFEERALALKSILKERRKELKKGKKEKKKSKRKKKQQEEESLEDKLVYKKALTNVELDLLIQENFLNDEIYKYIPLPPTLDEWERLQRNEAQVLDHVEPQITNEEIGLKGIFRQLGEKRKFNAPMSDDRLIHKANFVNALEEIHRKIPKIKEIELTLFAGSYGHVIIEKAKEYIPPIYNSEFQDCQRVYRTTVIERSDKSKPYVYYKWRNYASNLMRTSLVDPIILVEDEIFWEEILWEHQLITRNIKSFEQRNKRVIFREKIKARLGRNLGVCFWKIKKQKKKKRKKKFRKELLSDANENFMKSKIEVRLNIQGNLGFFVRCMNKKESFFLFNFIAE